MSDNPLQEAERSAPETAESTDIVSETAAAAADEDYVHPDAEAHYHHHHHRHHHRRGTSNRGRALANRAALIAIAAAMLLVFLAWVVMKRSDNTVGMKDVSRTESAAPMLAAGSTTTAATETTAITTTTTTAAATTTTTTAAATTTTTAATAEKTIAKPTTTGVKSSRTLLTYNTDGRYVQNTAAAEWNLLLVNDWNPLPSGYDSSLKLIEVGDRKQKVDARIAEPLNRMLTDGKAYGIGVQSGYRPATQQATLYWRKVDLYIGKGYGDTEAQQIAGTIVKRPGYSEHNSGLAVDLGGSGNFDLNASFEKTAAFRWLKEHCAEYGFILRFPKNKEDITGVIYEAWHFRYVGEEAARIITDNGWCLEEYLEKTGK